jgi:hypothetical protein
MSIEHQTYILLAITALLYLAVPLWLVLKGRLVRAGIAGLFVAFIPPVWQGVFWSDSAGTFGLLTLVLSILPLSAVLLGSLMVAARLLRMTCSPDCYHSQGESAPFMAGG